MTINFNVTGGERKRLVKTIGEITGAKAKYLGMPSTAFEIFGLTIDRTGTVETEKKPDELVSLIEALRGRGFAAVGFESVPADEFAPAEPEENEEQTGLTITLPKVFFTGETLGNLRKLVDAKGALIKKATGADMLAIIDKGEAVAFPWFKTVPADEMTHAASRLITALVKNAGEARRVTAKAREVENEKYAFRCFLLRLGFIGDETKKDREVLMRNLSGNSAFLRGNPKGGEQA